MDPKDLNLELKSAMEALKKSIGELAPKSTIDKLQQQVDGSISKWPPGMAAMCRRRPSSINSRATKM
jgi:hypothetical protein